MSRGGAGPAGPGRLRGPAAGQAARTPFVLLVVALLAGGLISLLLLNSALNEGSFQLSRLKKETTALTDEEQALQRDVDAYSAPDALQRRAQELGMVPGGSPAFVGPDGKVTGTAAVAESPTPAAPPPASPPAALPAASGTPSAPTGAPPQSPPPPNAPAVPGPAASSPQPGPQPTPNPGR
ncbi:hypothetical protein [Streptomyces sp. NPDC090445]|uniref:hypothetical protein n=1 Tax=Streptomyces sp. NPDC090445 TaxID=3365963 RepID=UPI0038013ADF